MKNKVDFRLNAAASLCALIIPLLNAALLGSLMVITETDVAYPERIAQIIQYAKELISVISVFASAGCLAYAASLGTAKRSVFTICLISVPLIYLTSALVDLGFYGDAAFSSVYLIPMVVNCCFEIIRYVVVMLPASGIGKRARRDKKSFTLELFSFEGAMSRTAVTATLTVFATLIVSSLTETISLLVEYGAPLNSSELTYLIVPYLAAVIYSVIGYFVIYLIGRSIKA